MNIVEAIKKAQKDNPVNPKEIALPNDDQCEIKGYRLRVKPFPNNLQCLEFYGDVRKIDNFPLSTNEIVRNDWELVN